VITMTSTTPPPAPAYGPPPEPRSTSTDGRRWTAGRVISVVLGAIAGLVALALLGGGISLLVADRTLRDADDFIVSPTFAVSSGGYAVTSGDVLLEGTSGDWLPSTFTGDVRVRVTPQTPDGPIFVGLAPAGQAESYLAGVSHTVKDGPGARSEDVSGGPPPGPPSSEDIWVANASGTGEQEVTWSPTTGRWSLVVMNPDGSAGVDATVQVGAQVPWLTGLAIGIIVLGVLAMAAAVVLVVIPLIMAGRTARQGPRPTQPQG
jgi:hypothetical protein